MIVSMPCPCGKRCVTFLRRDADGGMDDLRCEHFPAREPEDPPLDRAQDGVDVAIPRALARLFRCHLLVPSGTYTAR
jgi:hypothetical protein